MDRGHSAPSQEDRLYGVKFVATPSSTPVPAVSREPSLTVISALRWKVASLTPAQALRRLTGRACVGARRVLGCGQARSRPGHHRAGVGDHRRQLGSRVACALLTAARGRARPSTASLRPPTQPPPVRSTLALGPLPAWIGNTQRQAERAESALRNPSWHSLGWRACPHAQPGAPPVRCHQLPEGHSTYELSKVDTRHKYVDTSICSGLTLELTHTQVREWTRPDALALHASEFTLPDQDAFEAALVD